MKSLDLFQALHTIFDGKMLPNSKLSWRLSVRKQNSSGIFVLKKIRQNSADRQIKSFHSLLILDVLIHARSLIITGTNAVCLFDCRLKKANGSTHGLITAA